MKDVGALGHDALHMGDMRLAGKSIDGADLGEVGLTAELKGQIPHLIVLRLEVDVAVLFRLEAQGNEADDVLVDAEISAPLPAYPTHGMSFHVCNSSKCICT